MEFVFECRHQAARSMLLAQAATTLKGILFMEIQPPPREDLCWSIFLMEANDDLGRSLETPRRQEVLVSENLVSTLFAWILQLWQGLQSTPPLGAKKNVPRFPKNSDELNELALCLQPSAKPGVCLFLVMLETKTEYAREVQ